MTYFDYITGITIGDIAAGVISDQTISLSRTLVAIGLLGGLSIFASYIGERFRSFRKITEGEPTVVIKEGKILEENLHSMRIDIDHLRMLLRKKGSFSVAEVKFAVLETDGSLSVMKKTDVNKIANPSIELIIDGELDMTKLKEIGQSKEWVIKTLSERGFQRIEDVSYMEIYSNGKVYIDSYQDKV